jgi:hypothetical protein
MAELQLTVTSRPSTSWNPDIINKVRSLIMEDRRLTVREIANDTGISDGSAHMILIWACTQWLQNLCQSCFCVFASDPRFLGQARNSPGLPGSLWFLVVPQAEDAAERVPIWEPRGYNEKCDSIVGSHTKMNVSSNGRTTGLSVWSHKGTTMKEIRIGSQ